MFPRRYSLEYEYGHSCLVFSGYWFSLVLILMLSMRVNRLCGVMVRVLALSAESLGFDPGPGQTKDFKIGICCFSAKSKDWSAQSQNNVSG